MKDNILHPLIIIGSFIGMFFTIGSFKVVGCSAMYGCTKTIWDLLGL